MTLTSHCHSSLLLPVSYSCVYSCLLVRLVYLHSLARDRLYKLSSLYQSLLLVFSILVQLCLTLQAMIFNSSHSESLCPMFTSTIMDLICFTYSLFLLLVITSIAIVLRRRKELRREARAIWIYCLLSIIVWIAWISVSLVYQEYYVHIKGKTTTHCYDEVPDKNDFIFRFGVGGDNNSFVYHFSAAKIKKIDTHWENLWATSGKIILRSKIFLMCQGCQDNMSLITITIKI